MAYSVLVPLPSTCVGLTFLFNQKAAAHLKEGERATPRCLALSSCGCHSTPPRTMLALSSRRQIQLAQARFLVKRHIALIRVGWLEVFAVRLALSTHGRARVLPRVVAGEADGAPVPVAFSVCNVRFVRSERVTEQ